MNLPFCGAEKVQKQEDNFCDLSWSCFLFAIFLRDVLIKKTVIQ